MSTRVVHSKTVTTQHMTDDGHNAFFISVLEKQLVKCETRNQDHMLFVLRKAIAAIRKCKEALQTGDDAAKLKGIGAYVSGLLDKSLKGVEEEEPVVEERGGHRLGTGKTKTVILDKGEEVKRPAKRQKAQNKQYVPNAGSAPWALLLALHRAPTDTLSKEELLNTAQSLTDTAMRPKGGTDYYCGWSSMRILKKHGLIVDDKRKYQLTDHGKTVAALLDTVKQPVHDDLSLALKSSLESQPPQPSLNTAPIGGYKQGQINRRRDAHGDLTRIIDPSVEYDIVCLVDNREKVSLTWRCDQIVKDLTSMGIRAEVSVLPLGDFLFIARPKIGEDLVTKYIFERKQLDDLASSIISSRFEEQKLRLRSCGFSNATIIVEGAMRSWRSRSGKVQPKSLKSAMHYSYIQEGFSVVRTSSMINTLTYIRNMYLILDSALRRDGVASLIEHGQRVADTSNETVVKCMSFDDYKRISSKTRGHDTVTEIFIRMLSQIPRVSADSATAIAKLYPTPYRLREGFSRSSDPASMLLNVVGEGSTRRLGPAVSKNVYEFMRGPPIVVEEEMLFDT